jgi:exodeoxyribonuclease VII large subunit
VLPRPETLFAAPRQRLDQASDKLGHSLRRNLQVHNVAFNKIAARLQDRMLRERMRGFGERATALGERAMRAEKARLDQARRHLNGVVRELDLISYRKVLERGFALVRGEDGTVRRRADSLQSGESLTLTFADGDAKAVAGDGKPKQPRKKAADQGSLF